MGGAVSDDDDPRIEAAVAHLLDGCDDIALEHMTGRKIGAFFKGVLDQGTSMSAAVEITKSYLQVWFGNAPEDDDDE